ncbi:MAG: hypothetical protein DI537_14595 [Stutzerimonas stutzeri]|nr:MAG: hypothetical protein DI537_14595 [Stutzerimonas stutzeri]
MKIEGKTYERFQNETGNEVMVRHGNMGEPYREGIEIELSEDGHSLHAFLEKSEVKSLRDLLLRLYPLPPVRG